MRRILLGLTVALLAGCGASSEKNEAAPAAKSTAVSWAPSKISRLATLSRSVAGSLIAPSSNWLSRTVVTV